MRWPSLLCSLLCITSLFAKEQPSTTPPPRVPLPSLFELQGRLGGQYNIDQTTRDIYGSWSPLFQIEAASGTWKNIYGWFNVGWSHRAGNTTLLHTPTTYDLVPLALGFKYAIPVSHCFFYLGAGANLSYLHTNDSSPYVPRHTSKWDWGCTFKSGVRFPLPQEKVFLELFVDYSYLPFHFSSQSTLEKPSVDMGGLFIGIGLGGQLVRNYLN
jgi:hypothetical protein